MTSPVPPLIEKRAGKIEKRGGKRDGAGSKPLPPGQKKVPITLKIAPDLHEWVKSLPPGSAERILQKAHIDSLVV